VPLPLLILASGATAAVGAFGGIGGALLLVPLLIATGTPAAEAAPLGLLLVAAASVAAGSTHIREGAVNHRLGVVIEIAASTGVVVGALVSDSVSERFLAYTLAAAAVLAAAVGGTRRGIRNPPDPRLGEEDAGERFGQLSGAVVRHGGVAPYTPRHLPLGLTVMLGAGLVSGLSGVGGGFIKTPVLNELMYVPIKVAAATSTFTVGITAAAGLLVFAVQGRIEVHDGAAVVLGALLGGVAGVRAQGRLRAIVVRRLLSVILLVIAVLLMVTA
jgi:uncharacterized membrane protein YfcA